MIKITKSFIFKDLTFWITSTRKIGISFYSYPVDIETTNTFEFESNFSRLLKSMSEKVKLRIGFYSDHIAHDSEIHSRLEHLRQIGETVNNLCFHFEMKIDFIDIKNINEIKTSDKIAHKLLELISLEQLKNCGYKLTNIKDINPFFWDLEQPLIQKDSFIDSGFEKIGILKLLKASNNVLSLDSISSLLTKIPKPFEVHVQILKISNTITKMKFSQAAKRDATSNSVSGQTKSQAADQAVASLEFNGDTYHSFEWCLALRRTSEDLLKNDLKLAFNELSRFSDFSLESVGTYPTFISTQLGSDFHFSGLFEAITEKDEVLTCYLPILSYGNSDLKKISLNSFAFHRLDGSIDFFNQFDQVNNNANLNIIGQSGKGKSVLINRKIQADSFDPRTTLIIVDVKGSHARLIETLNGDIYHINLKSSSGINPIQFLKINSDDKTIETVKTFISELCLDDDEKKLNEIEGADLEEILINYTEHLIKYGGEYTIDELLEFIPDSFSRKKLLRRFSKKGLLKQIFSESVDYSAHFKSRNRIRYYNFQNIDTASNPAISRAIMAAIMADSSFTLTNKDIGEKLMFISDETPFFIKHCFRSFSLLSKNVRALNGSLMLTVQVSQDLIVDNDKSLIDNAVSHIFLSGDDNIDIFKSRFNLNDSDASRVFNLSSVNGKYSQFLIKDGHGSRLGHLYLSKKEYWQATTKASEVELIQKIQKVFPDLSEDLVIDLISENSKLHDQGGFINV